MNAGKSNQIKHTGGCMPVAAMLRARLILVDMNSDLITEESGLP